MATEGRVRVIECQPVYCFRYRDQEAETCRICRKPLSLGCLACDLSQSAAACGVEAGASCGVEAGASCGHRFHEHCIQGWLVSHRGCPLDGLAWRGASAQDGEHPVERQLQHHRPATDALQPNGVLSRELPEDDAAA